jgi:hypothetical protein
MYLQPFANEVWFLRICTRGCHRCGRLSPAGSRAACSCFSAFASACALLSDSAAGLDSIVFSFIFCCGFACSVLADCWFAGCGVACGRAFALPSLLPLRQVQPAPSNSPAAVAATVPPSAPRTPGIVEAAAPVALSGSRRAHFEELDAAEGEDEELPWICVSRLMYLKYRVADAT